MILAVGVTIFVTVTANARIPTDKKLHAGSGFAIALSVNIVLQKLSRPEYELPAQIVFNPLTMEGMKTMPDRIGPYVTRVDGKRLSPLERAVFSAIMAGSAGALYEYVNRRESRPDANDVLATFVGGVIAGIFTVTIGF